MKQQFKIFALSVVAGLVAAGGIAPTAAQADVHFRKITYAEAQKQAAKEKKKVMIDFYTDWCGWCKVLDHKTYTDPTVEKITDDKFVSVKIDAEKGEGVDLAKKYAVTGYPTIVFLDASGKELDRVVGYQDAGRFARSLNTAAAGGTKTVLNEVQGKKPTNDPEKWLVAANYYAEHGNLEAARSAFSNVVQYDKEDKAGAREEAEYGLAYLTDGPAKYPALEKALTQYPNREEGRQAIMMLIKHDIQETETPEEVLRPLDLWLSRHPDDANTMNFFAWTAAEKGVLFEKAEEYITRAIALSQDPEDRASTLDTRAELLYKQHRSNEALQTEDQALALLAGKEDGKLYQELKKQRAKFAADVATPDSTPAAGSNQ